MSVSTQIMRAKTIEEVSRAGAFTPEGDSNQIESLRGPETSSMNESISQPNINVNETSINDKTNTDTRFSAKVENYKSKAVRDV